MEKGINRMTYILNVKDGKATLKELSLPKRDDKGRFVRKVPNGCRLRHTTRALFEIIY